MYVEGIDLSFLQGKIDWYNVALGGVKFAIIRAGEAYGYDNMYATNIAGAKAAGLMVGSYFVFHPNLDPIKQADIYATHAAQTIDMPPALDLEIMGGVSPQVFATNLETFLSRVEGDFKRTAMLYTYPYFWKGILPAIGNSYTDRCLWLAQYEVPKPSPLAPWASCSIWQYSGNGGHVQGVHTDCDKDRFMGSDDDFRQWIKTTA